MSSTSIFFGDTIRLWTVSAHAKTDMEKLGGYIGTYTRSGYLGPIFCVPPIMTPYNALFEVNTFVISDPADPTNSSNTKRELRYGDSFLLVDELGCTINNKLGAPVQLLGPRALDQPGSISLTFTSSEHKAQTPINYSHKNLTLNYVKPPKSGKSGHVLPLPVTNCRREGTRVTGGYLTTDGTGLPITFEVRSVSLPLASVSLIAGTSAFDQADYDVDVYTAPGNFKSAKPTLKYATLNTVIVDAWDREVPLTQTTHLPANGSIVINVPDIGQAKIPVFCLPTPPLNMALASSFAPPTTNSEFILFSQNPQEPVEPIFFEKEVALRGRFQDASLLLKWQRSSVLPPEKDYSHSSVQERKTQYKRGKAPAPGPMAVLFGVSALVYTVHTLMNKHMIQTLLDQSYADPNAFFFDFFRIALPGLIIALIFFLYPRISRTAAPITAVDKSAQNTSQKMALWSVQLSVPHTPRCNDLLNTNTTNTASEPIEITADRLTVMQILDGLRAGVSLSSGEDSSSGLVSLDEEDGKKLGKYNHVLQTVQTTGSTPDTVNRLLAVTDIPHISYTVRSPHPSMGNDVQFKEYEPLLFKAIRDSHGISNDDYIQSWMYTLDKLPSLSIGAGRSGALFMNSADGKFLFKSCTKDDLTTLRFVLRDYAQYVCNHPSRLMKFIALHRMHITATKETRYIVVATNMFYTPPVYKSLTITERYDLKGRKPKKAPERRPNEPNRGIWKDNQIGRVFNVDGDVRDSLVAVLKRDVQFLREHDMIDYSLLCGVANDSEHDQVDRNLLNVDVDAFNHPGTAPLVHSSLKNEVYTVGIIDFLSRYQTWKKKTAHFFKSFLWEDAELSTINADLYASRFSDYMDVMYPSPDAILVSTSNQITEIVNSTQHKKVTKDELQLPAPAQAAFKADRKSSGAIVTAPSGQKIVIVPFGVAASPRPNYK